ncbi:MAG: AAA family ATPase [Anaerolineae bacterium]|nr:AAA family ATPase [Anaerolineae bacterium]
MSFDSDLDAALRARFSLILAVTSEEERVLALIRAVCERSNRPALMWDAADGFRVLAGRIGAPGGTDPMAALQEIEKAEGNPVFVLRDFHEFMSNPLVKRKLRNVAQRLKTTSKSIILTSPTGRLPDELRDDAVRLDLALPAAGEIEQILARVAALPGVRANLTPLGREKLAQAAVGLSSAQAQRVFARAVTAGGTLDDRHIDLVTDEKKQIIRESNALEYYAVTETPDAVGGYGALKQWLRLRERAFTREARDYGLPTPRGVALIGIPGTGKSLTAKMIGGLWRQPLLRLDIGALYGSFLGQSEERARRALELAAAVAPCVLWIDEIEKGLAHGGADAGTSARVFGTILTWMQEKSAPVFVVATANDVTRLPPELIRRGRFDEVFFLDLPTRDERLEIYAAHLTRRRRLTVDFDLEAMAGASDGFVGAEIEQTVIEAMHVGFNEAREFTTEDVLAAAKRTVPLSISQRERIDALRSWLREGRAKSASDI